MVLCRSDYAYAGRPTYFSWEDEVLEIASVFAEWRTPTAKCFQVATSDGRTFILSYDEAADEWQAVSQ